MSDFITLPKEYFSDTAISNFDKIYDLVEKYFCLDKESLEKFKQQLYTPTIARDLFAFVEGGTDLRKTFQFDGNNKLLLGKFDASWKNFKILFRDYISTNNLHIGFFKYPVITYQNFLDNKVDFKGNKIKLKKILTKYYVEVVEKKIADFQNIIEYYKTKGYSQSDVASEVMWRYSDFINSASMYGFDCSVFMYLPSSYEFISSELKFNTESLKEKIEKGVVKCLEFVGETKSKLMNEMKVVLSFNFADWFLASTKESWTSCISLESTYEACFWAGLPGLITDQSRALLYTNIDGKTKEYLGITVDKLDSRSWLIYTDKNSFYPSRWYPSEKLDGESIRQITNLPLENGERGEYTSKYNVDLLYNYNSESLFIYQDQSKFEFDFQDKFVDYDNNLILQSEGANTGRVIIKIGEWSGHFNITKQMLALSFKDKKGFFGEGSYYDYSVTLTELIDSEQNIIDFQNDNSNKTTCCECGESYYEDEMYHQHGEMYCSDCYREIFTECSHCGNYYHSDDMHSVELQNYYSSTIGRVSFSSSIVCENCLDHAYFCSEYDELYYSHDIMCEIKLEDGYTVNVTTHQRDNNCKYNEKTDRYTFAF